MKKKLIVLVLAVTVIASAAIGATLAYFTAKDDATNVFTVGNVKIDLTEPAWTSAGGGAEQAATVYPGEALPKDPTVKNIGANPCVVRIKIEWPELPTGVDPIQYRTVYDLGVLGADWYKADDGYFYYLKPLRIASDPDPLNASLPITTSALFTSIVMPRNLGNGDITTKYNVNVKAEAVQAQGIFPSFATIRDGISTTGGASSELATVQQFFTTAFKP